jgi:hypothetical protein
VEGYVFDGVDGSQMAFWTRRETKPSAPHVHGFDEQGSWSRSCYRLIIYTASGAIKKIPMRAGEESFIPYGVPQGGEVEAGPEPSAHLADIAQTGSRTVRSQ